MSRTERYEKLLQALLKGGRITLSPWRFEAEGPLGILTVFVLALILLVALSSAARWLEPPSARVAVSPVSPAASSPGDRFDCIGHRIGPRAGA